MAKYELSKDWIQKNTSKIKKAYILALKRKYDLDSKEDILELLKDVDPENATEENVKVFSGVLKLFNQNINKKFGIGQQKKTKLVN